MDNNLETPCYVIDAAEFERGITSFGAALTKEFKHHIIGYSVKTNSLPWCLKRAKELGCHAEVVSHDEFSLARRCGYPIDQIIYNGPMKSKGTFIEAICNGAIVNIDTHREISWLRDLPSGRTYAVGLRLSINISEISPDDASTDNDNSRFGFSDDTEEFGNAVKAISAMGNVKINGLHIHRTTHDRNPEFYRNSITYALKTAKKYHLCLSYLDVGGGYFGIFKNKPTFADYALQFKKAFGNEITDNFTIIVEPGNALTASAFEFHTKVIDIKHNSRELHFLTTDGSRNDVDPFFRKTAYLHEIVYSSKETRASIPHQVVAGCTCLENDRLFTLDNQPEIKVDDRIIYHNVGAYTLCLSPLFIRYWPAIYVLEGGKYIQVRTKWTEQEYIQNSTI